MTQLQGFLEETEYSSMAAIFNHCAMKGYVGCERSTGVTPVEPLGNLLVMGE